MSLTRWWQWAEPYKAVGKFVINLPNNSNEVKGSLTIFLVKKNIM